MIYRPDTGKIYDTVFFCLEYFNKQTVDKSFRGYYPYTDFMFECLDQLHKQIPALPPIIRPFVHYQDEIATPLTMFFNQHNCLAEVTFDGFLETFENKSETLYQLTRDSVFRSADKAVIKTISLSQLPATYVDIINQLDLPDDYKLQIALLFGNFDYAVTELVRSLKLVYGYVDALHQKYAKQISDAYAMILSNHKVKLYHRFIGLDESTEFEYVSIALLNQYIVYYQSRDSRNGFLLGVKHQDSISERLSDQHVSAETFLTICGNETRIAVIRKLIEHGELTTTQLAKLLNIPVTTLIRHMDAMLSYNMICHSRRSGLQIFYRLNTNYFKQARGNVLQLFDEIIGK